MNIEIYSWEECKERMLTTNLWVKCVDGKQKKHVKDILVEELGGRAGAGNNDRHLFVRRCDPRPDADPFWDAHICPAPTDSYISADLFFHLYESRFLEEETKTIDISQLL